MLKKALVAVFVAIAAALALPAAAATAGPQSYYADVCNRTAITSKPGSGQVRHTLNVGNNTYVQDFRVPGYAFVTYPSRGYVPAADLCPR